MIPVLAIPGSVGKTSTRRLLSHILSGNMRIAENPKNFNNHIGLPISILQMRGDEDLAVLEMGSSGIGEIRDLCHIIQPQYGLITAIAPAHISGFGSVENIRKAKFELFDAVRDDGILFINADDDRVASYPADARRRVTYGMTRPADIQFSVRDIDASGCYTLAAENRTFRLQSSGKGAAINACAAYTAARTLGTDINTIIRGITTYRSEPGRGAIESWNGITLIDDTYNASPLSVRNAVSLLNSMRTSGRKIMVFADMLEMGADARSSHEEIGTCIAGSDIAELLCYGTESRYTVTAAREGGLKKTLHFDNKEKLADHLLSVIQPGDTVLFKGSRGEKVEDIISLMKGKRYDI
ncbi:MAG: UDP-N-acetylmuramoyl-tripeptide--D-alanyl-D-alanine ligase, partial [FCB group bacterium]|nr:UDP-N-acetylmuramoyl-tripeptide--D-alanyl-D-alanine ligase [FCB group bacterium]